MIPTNCPKCGDPLNGESQCLTCGAVARALACRHCGKEIEAVNGYDYAQRGAHWRHVDSKSIYCRNKEAAP